MSTGQRPTGRGGPHVFVDDVAVPALEPEDEHHLRRALRLRDGDPLTVGDGAGSWRPARFGTTVEPTSEIVTAAPLPHRSVAFALTKGSKPELVVQKLTELGIARIVLFEADRSVVRWDDAKVTKQSARLARVAREAAMQSRRVWLPEVVALESFGSVMAGAHVVRADLDGGAWPAQTDTVVVGPEGGWSAEEAAVGTPVSLGATVLRAETAAIAAAVLLLSGQVTAL